MELSTPFQPYTPQSHAVPTNPKASLMLKIFKYFERKIIFIHERTIFLGSMSNEYGD